MLLNVRQSKIYNSRNNLSFYVILRLHYDVRCWFKVTIGKSIVCQSNNIMHYIMLQTA